MPVPFDPTGDMSCCDGRKTVALCGSFRCAGGHCDRCAMRCHAGLANAKRVKAAILRPTLCRVFPPSVGRRAADRWRDHRFVRRAVYRFDGRGATSATRWQCRAPKPGHRQRTGPGGGLAAGDVVKNLQRSPWWPPGRTCNSICPARIQPQQADISIEYDRRLMRVTHRIFVADDIVVDHPTALSP